MSEGRIETRDLADSSDELRPRGPLVQLFATPPEPCPYLADQMERKLLTPLIGPRAAANYDDLALHGFRRSHTIAYRPACRSCDACIPVRIPVEAFAPSRNMRKAIRGCVAWRAEEFVPPQAHPQHYRIFQRYQATRHDGGDMARMSYGEYRSMVEESFVPTVLAEFRDTAGEVQAVSIYDQVAGGLSGLYQFFEPEAEASSPGTFMIVWLVERARALGLSYVYLGYYIEACRKMAYKSRFQPLEALGSDGRWRRFEP